MNAQPVTITAGIVPTRDVSIEGRNEDGTYGLMIESATIENREYIAGLEGDERDAYRVVERDRDAIGTLYLDPVTGTSYRLRGHNRDWSTGRVDHTSYSTFLPGGASSSATALPEGSFAVWSPAPIA